MRSTRLSARSSVLRSRRGMTIIELLLFAAIFASASIVFITILMTITRIQLRENGNAEVNQQTQFLIQTLQYHIERSYLMDMPIDVATTTITLRMATGTDPTIIVASTSGSITSLYVQQNYGPYQRLTSPRVTLGNVSFTRHVNAPGHDTLEVAFTMDYVTNNPQQRASKTIRLSVSRSGNIPFDSDVLNTAGGQSIGVNPGEWRSINETIFLPTNGNVGIGTRNPSAKLDVFGGVRLFTSATSTCDSTLRGALAYVEGGAGVKDEFLVCHKTSLDTYAWGALY